MKAECEGGRHSYFSAEYCPHLVVDPSSQYLAVRVLSVDDSLTPGEVFPDSTTQVTFQLMYYPKFSYTSLEEGSNFKIMEGATCVGTGTVLKCLMPEAA